MKKVKEKDYFINFTSLSLSFKFGDVMFLAEFKFQSDLYISKIFTDIQSSSHQNLKSIIIT